MAKKKKRGGAGSNKSGGNRTKHRDGPSATVHKTKTPPVDPAKPFVATSGPPPPPRASRRESAPPALGTQQPDHSCEQSEELAELLGPLGPEAPSIDDLLEALSRKEASGRGPSPPRSLPQANSPGRQLESYSTGTNNLWIDSGDDGGGPGRGCVQHQPLSLSLEAELDMGHERADQDEDALDEVAIELAALRAGGAGALHEIKLQAALEGVKKEDANLQLQTLQLRRFCQKRVPGFGTGCSSSHLGYPPQPSELLSDCLAMLKRRQEGLANEIQAGEIMAYRLKLAQQDEELAAAMERAEAAEAALELERVRIRQERATAAAVTSVAAPAVPGEVVSAVDSRSSVNDLLSSDAASGNSSIPVSQGIEMAARLGEAQTIIEQIRESKLVGTEIDSPAIRDLQATVGRALEKLARDLYASSDHFLSELVQNADDNEYLSLSPSEANSEWHPPELRLVLSDDAVYVINNERGFTAADVRAICDVGAGTKVGSEQNVARTGTGNGGLTTAAIPDAKAHGRIGRKGIGFKSVFMISDQPHICSGGFSFRFDTLRHGNFGCIVPEWIEPSDIAARLPDGVGLPAPTKAGTVLFLPLKEGAKPVDVTSILTSASLLFLRRLCRLVVEDRRTQSSNSGVIHELWVDAQASAYSTARESNNLPRVHSPSSTLASPVRVSGHHGKVNISGDGTSPVSPSSPASPGWFSSGLDAVTAWLHRCDIARRCVRSRRFKQNTAPNEAEDAKASSDIIDEEQMEYLIFSRELEVPSDVQVAAAAVDPDHRPGSASELVLGFPLSPHPLAPQPICAYLPVCDAGLPFVVQADWSLVSSRQAVRADSPLNLWLRAQIAPTVALAISVVPELREQIGRYLPPATPAGASVAANQQGQRRRHCTMAGNFWTPVGLELRQELRSCECIKTEGGRWRRPDQVLIRPAGCGTDLISNDWLLAASAAATQQSTAGAEPYCPEEHVVAAADASCEAAAGTVWAVPVDCRGFEFIAPDQLAALGLPQASALGCRQFGLIDLKHCLAFEPVDIGCERGGNWLACKPASWFDQLGCFLHMEVVGNEACKLLTEMQIWPLLWHSGSAESSVDQHQQSQKLGRLADGPIFSSIPACWAGVLRSGAIRVLREPPHSVPYQSLAAAAGIRPATAVDIARCIRDQHLAGLFSNAASVWAGLQFLKDHVFTAGQNADETEVTQLAAELRLVLCAPSYAGPLMLLRELTVPSLLGVRCTSCFDQFDAQVDPRTKGHKEVVEFVPPRFVSAQESSLDVKPRIEGGSIITTLALKAAATAGEWTTATSSAGATRGRVCFEVRIGSMTSHACGVGFCTAAGAAASIGKASSPRAGGLVFFGDGTIWFGAVVAIGPQIFGAGDTVTVAVDVDCARVNLAVNGTVVTDLGILKHRAPSQAAAANSVASTVAAAVAANSTDEQCKSSNSLTSASLGLPRCMAGGELRPLVVKQRLTVGLNTAAVSSSHFGFCGTMTEVRLGGGTAVSAFHANGYRWIAARLSAGIRARRAEPGLSVDLRLAPDCATSEQAMGWEAFLLVVGGSAPHDSSCGHRHVWNGQAHGDCAVCLSPFVFPASPPVAVANCEHLFHASCIHKWAARKPTCPVCRGPADRACLRPVEPDLTIAKLSTATCDLLHALAAEDSRGKTWTTRKLLLAALQIYAHRPLPSVVLRTAGIATTLGVKPLGDTFVEPTFRRLGGPCLPYLSVPNLPRDLTEVLGQLGVACKLGRQELLRAVGQVAGMVASGDGPAEATLLELFAGLYSSLYAVSLGEDSLESLANNSDVAAEATAMIRSAFAASPLIFAGGSRLRLKPPQAGEGSAEGRCCWDGPRILASILDVPRLRSLYPSLRRFFIDIVGVRELSLWDCTHALRRLGRAADTIDVSNGEFDRAQQVAAVYSAAQQLLALSFPNPCDRDDTFVHDAVVRAALVRLPLICTASQLRTNMDCWLPTAASELVIYPEPATAQLHALLAAAPASCWRRNGKIEQDGNREVADTDEGGAAQHSVKIDFTRYAVLDHGPFHHVPELLAALRPCLYGLSEATRLRRVPHSATIERVHELLWDGWCKDYLRRRFGVDIGPYGGLEEENPWGDCPHPVYDEPTRLSTVDQLLATLRQRDCDVQPGLDFAVARREAAASFIAALHVQRASAKNMGNQGDSRDRWPLQVEVDLFPPPTVAIAAGKPPEHATLQPNAHATCTLHMSFEYSLPPNWPPAVLCSGTLVAWFAADPHHALGHGCELTVVANSGSELDKTSIEALSAGTGRLAALLRPESPGVDQSLEQHEADEVRAAREYFVQRRADLAQHDDDVSNNDACQYNAENVPTEDAATQEPQPEQQEQPENAAFQQRPIQIVADALRGSQPPWNLPDWQSPDNTFEPERAANSPLTLSEQVPATHCDALESAAFNYLEHHLPGFNTLNWVGRTASTNQASNSLGYAFEYIDRDGLLGSEPGCRLLIAVKGTANASFEVTAAEYESMRWAASQPISQSSSLRTEFMFLHLRPGVAPGLLVASHLVRDPIGAINRQGLTTDGPLVVSPTMYTASYLCSR